MEEHLMARVDRTLEGFSGRAVILGDPHASPDYPNDRFYELGRYAREVGADHVHCVGDFTDFASLLTHGSKLSQEGLRIADDVAAGTDALREFDRGLRGRRMGASPTKTITLGNHDARPSRRCAENPALEGFLRDDLVEFKQHGWKAFPFLQRMMLGELCCRHYVPSGAMGRPTGGTNPSRSIFLKSGGTPVLVGHDHRYNARVFTDDAGNKKWVILAGCAIHEEMRDEPWCAATSDAWDSGVMSIDFERGKVRGVSWEPAWW